MTAAPPRPESWHRSSRSGRHSRLGHPYMGACAPTAGCALTSADRHGSGITAEGELSDSWRWNATEASGAGLSTVPALCAVGWRIFRSSRSIGTAGRRSAPSRLRSPPATRLTRLAVVRRSCAVIRSHCPASLLQRRARQRARGEEGRTISCSACRPKHAQLACGPVEPLSTATRLPDQPGFGLL
jgi:hypothetical protein